MLQEGQRGGKESHTHCLEEKAPERVRHHHKSVILHICCGSWVPESLMELLFRCRFELLASNSEQQRMGFSPSQRVVLITEAEHVPQHQQPVPSPEEPQRVNLTWR